ncbi:DUF1642 domain-containing protein [Pediococcus pentosaceus]|uniref:DUF1642 domain-containing protein n=1 Tax=Pediococcus pentosaceus TaxID=1255 RepID=UPI001C93172F|nr:DUF1642 domain-containing protein [Pediococcus pentosaceus]MBY4581318.1 DUF1642 domain-containing protein [Pediococcus pentosaceus]
MTKEEVLEKLEEERESAKSKILYGQSRNLSVKRYGWYFNGVNYAIDLAEKLDEPKKVVIPKLIAKLIEGASVIYGNEPLRIAHGIVAKGTSNDNGGSWLSDVNNQKLLLNAIANGYEVEKEKKYRVKIDSKLYFQRFENIEAVFVIDDSLGVKESSPVFTREVGNKILETLGVESGQLEEVEDD